MWSLFEGAGNVVAFSFFFFFCLFYFKSWVGVIVLIGSDDLSFSINFFEFWWANEVKDGLGSQWPALWPLLNCWLSGAGKEVELQKIGRGFSHLSSVLLLFSAWAAATRAASQWWDSIYFSIQDSFRDTVLFPQFSTALFSHGPHTLNRIYLKAFVNLGSLILEQMLLAASPLSVFW